MRIIKKYIIILIISLVSANLYAEKFRVNINHVVFHIPEDTASYLEMQFFFLGEGLTYKLNSAQRYQATAKITLRFTHEETKQIIDKQYNFRSDEYEDLALGKNGMYNLVRIALPSGNYRMELTASDANDTLTPPLAYQTDIKMNFDREKIYISDIQPLSVWETAVKETNFSKYGYDYMPYFSTFYPENITKLTCFAEVYNMDKAGKELSVHSYIAEKGQFTPFSEMFKRERKLHNNNKYVLVQSFDIDSLPSGHYHLVIDVRDEAGALYQRANLPFVRSNPSVVIKNTAQLDSLPFDTLKRYLDYIHAIANTAEREFIRRVSSNDYAAATEFFQNFWYRRNKDNPHTEWFNYYKRVMQANNNYTTLTFKGYKTDRGYCYLKYGPPNYIEFYPSEVNSYSFEIWSYYDFEATGQNDVYFVFYEKDLVTKDFRLLHSNATGEIQNAKWKQILKIEDMNLNMPDDGSLNRNNKIINTDDDGF